MGEKLVNNAERHEARSEQISELAEKEAYKHDKKVERIIDKTVDKVLDEDRRHDKRVENIEENYEKGLEKLAEKNSKNQGNTDNTSEAQTSVDINISNSTGGKTNIEVNISDNNEKTIVNDTSNVVKATNEGTVEVSKESYKQLSESMNEKFAQVTKDMDERFGETAKDWQEKMDEHRAEIQAKHEQYIQEGYTEVPHGVYKINENGSFNYSCVNVPRAAINLLPDEVRSSTDQMSNIRAGSELYMKTQAYRDLMGQENLTPGEAKFVEGYKELLKEYRLAFDGNVLERSHNDSEVHRNDGVKYQFSDSGVSISTHTNLSEIEQENKVYLDLQDRQSNGEMRFGAEERKFIQQHMENMKEQGLYHTPDGKMVELSTDVTVTPKGPAYSISDSGVKEEGLYGYKNSMQNFVTEARECLGDDAKAKDVLEFKNFLMQDEIYKDIIAKETSGVEFTAEQKEAIAEFKQVHEERFSALQEKHNLERGNNGKIAVSKTTEQIPQTPRNNSGATLQTADSMDL